MNEPQLKAETTTFDSGAVRSADCAGYRYDLITPIGLAALAEACGRKEGGGGIDGALNCIFLALGHLGDDGDTRQETLAGAARCLSIEIARYECPSEASAFEAAYTGPHGRRFQHIPPAAMARLAATCAAGAEKYSPFNWEQGMPAWDLLNHAIRHCFKYLDGDITEDHLAHALWGVLAAIHSLTLWPELNEGTLRGPGCVPPTGGLGVALKKEPNE